MNCSHNICTTHARVIQARAASTVKSKKYVSSVLCYLYYNMLMFTRYLCVPVWNRAHLDRVHYFHQLLYQPSVVQLTLTTHTHNLHSQLHECVPYPV